MADNSHVFSAVTFANLGQIVLKSNVEHPMQGILDLPVKASRVKKLFCRHGPGSDVETAFPSNGWAFLYCAIDTADGGDIGGLVASEPSNVRRYMGGSLLDASMAFIMPGMLDRWGAPWSIWSAPRRNWWR